MLTNSDTEETFLSSQLVEEAVPCGEYLETEWPETCESSSEASSIYGEINEVSPYFQILNCLYHM